MDLAGFAFDVQPVNLTMANGVAQVDFQIANFGDTAAGAFDVEFFLSDDSVIDLADTPLKLHSSDSRWNPAEPTAYHVSGGLAAGSVHAPSSAVALAIPTTDPFSDGKYYVGMIVDADDDVNEAHETNNSNQGQEADTEAVTYITPATFPFEEDWESSSFADYWEAIPNATGSDASTGQVRVTSENEPYQGDYHAVLDDDNTDDDYSLNQLILHIDLAGHAGVSLTYYNREWDYYEEWGNDQSQDAIHISVDGGGTWHEVVSLTGDNSTETYTARAYDLDSVGLTYSNDTLIRFQANVAWSIPYDGMAFDNIRVTEPMITLDEFDNLLITETAGGDTDNMLTIQSDTTAGQFIISDPINILSTSISGATGSATHSVYVPFSSVVGTQIIVNTLGGDDSLTVDFSLGNFAKAITYNGGTDGSTGDSLTVTGGTFADTTFNYTDSSSGTIDITDNQTITYTDLEPLRSTLTATNVTLNYGTTAETITVADSGTAGQTTVTSTAGESTTFNNPTGSLTIDAGDGSDTVDVGGLGSGFSANLSVAAEDVSFTGAATLGNLTVTADTIALGAVVNVGSHNATFQPADGSDTIGIGGGSGTFHLDDDELTTYLNSSGTVTIGTSGGTGAVAIDEIDLSGETYDLAILGGPISGSGNVTMPDSKTLILQAYGDGDISGVIAGNGVNLTKTGTGIQTLSGANTYTGVTSIGEGTLLVTGSVAGAVDVNGGTLGGTGAISGRVSMTASGGIVAPGASAGRLIVDNDVTLSGAGSYDVELNGTAAVAGYDQLHVTGANRSVDLADATLNVSLGFSPAIGDAFTIIENVDSGSSVSNTFRHLTEGFPFKVSGSTFTITYAGGADNNDVVLTVTDELPDVTVSVSPASVDEDGSTNLVYTFTRAGATSGDLTVNFSVSGAADDATDYAVNGAAVTYEPSTNTGTVTISSGSSTATVTVEPALDSTVEPNEDVVLNVVPGMGYTAGAASSAAGEAPGII